MADETTPLLPSERRSSWTGIGSVLSLLPVVVLMNVHHGVQNIVPLLFDPTLISTIRHSSVLIGFLSALLSTPFWTALGDRHGRRTVLLISLLGALFPNLAVVLIHRFDLSPFFYLLGTLLEGFLGGFTTFRAVMYAYTAERVSENLRLGIFGIFQGVMSLSFYAPQYFAVDILNVRALAQIAPLAWLLLFLLLLFLLLPIACLYVFLVVPESLSRLDDQTPEESRDGTHSRLDLILGLAICLQSFVNATEDAHGRQHWFQPGLPYWDLTLKSLRCFLIVPALTLFRPILRFSANQWDLRLSFLSPVIIIVGQPVCCIFMLFFLVLSPRKCGIFFSDGCVLFVIGLLVGAIGFIILPGLANIGGMALLSFAAGFGPSNNKGVWWGKLSVLQSFAEGIFVVLGDQPLVPINEPDERWDPIFTACLVYTLHALTAGLVRLLERWRARIEQAQNVL